MVGVQDVFVQFVLNGHGLAQLVGADELEDLNEMFWADVDQGADDGLETESECADECVVAGIHDVAVLLQQCGGFVQVVVGVVDTSEVLDLAFNQVPEAGHRH